MTKNRYGVLGPGCWYRVRLPTHKGALWAVRGCDIAGTGVRYSRYGGAIYRYIWYGVKRIKGTWQMAH